MTAPSGRPKQRLHEIERRAEDAERRAAFAERLAQLKIEESERERRLDEVISGIDRAEERAREAEMRAEAAERAAADALERGSTARGPVAPPAAPAEDEAGPDQQEAAEAVQISGAAPPVAPPSGGPSGTVNLNTASFEELREADLSVTQATRILAYRERFGGYASVEDLEKVPGFPAETVAGLGGRFTV